MKRRTFLQRVGAVGAAMLVPWSVTETLPIDKYIYRANENYPGMECLRGRFEVIARAASRALAAQAPPVMLIPRRQLGDDRLDQQLGIDMDVADEWDLSLAGSNELVRPAMTLLANELKHKGVTIVGRLPITYGPSSAIQSAFIGGLRVQEFPTVEAGVHSFRFDMLVG